ncbi:MULTISPECIES: sulfurtransferase complex subunit TusC [Vibrio]|uniref:sulfurtransferase complex subunit TusC n=1 Tax=Vibrio TaxID=662 RepID=UPI0001B93B37|nr:MULTISPECIES: sulfurtransferase complex subunit TusC [Vibrio]EEX35581.1 tRNA 5-methylaminomethyl-2-thiouridine synthase TusC [Vibrio coralliilyticus ATCC BAA-450]MCM5511546.1 sulfurtransferase complex subunit TusC [Vibrio sp. SCSIO 43169]MDE3900861.1 sulfurtransferase complex subunit TusC [Vibrio sp. CC007]NRF17494.1 sulfurtransferase complex subunit TusC [Vibrio coralliilyticus]NRF65277.1 sulfurtransferase complex subunit TusC [Vibrio coralliilyticus]
MSQLTYVFRSAPHGSSSGREGVDALLAASAYCEDISVLFIGDGVYQLIAGQQTGNILSKDYSPMLKLFDLYDIEQVYVCSDSLAERGLAQADLVIDVESLSVVDMQAQLHRADKVLSF